MQDTAGLHTCIHTSCPAGPPLAPTLQHRPESSAAAYLILCLPLHCCHLVLQGLDLVMQPHNDRIINQHNGWGQACEESRHTGGMEEA